MYSCSERLAHGTMATQLRDLPKASKHQYTMVMEVQREPQLGSTMSRSTSHSGSKKNSYNKNKTIVRYFSPIKFWFLRSAFGAIAVHVFLEENPKHVFKKARIEISGLKKVNDPGYDPMSRIMIFWTRLWPIEPDFDPLIYIMTFCTRLWPSEPD